jgi:ribosome assembly protein YihI (activator of Der GTPase)
MQKPTKHELQERLKELQERLANGPELKECIQKTVDESLRRAGEMLDVAEYLFREFGQENVKC